MDNQVLNKMAVLFLLLLLVSACAPAEKPAAPSAVEGIVPTAEPTAAPAPTLTPTPQLTQDWVGTWFLWVGDGIQNLEVSFSTEGNHITGTNEKEGESTKINAKMSLDGITAVGDWQSSNGISGPINMLISEDRQEFAGNLGGEVMFCGSREGSQKPNPCLTKITGDWSGEWVVWLGPDETEVILFFKQEGSEVDVMIYDFEGKVSEDGRTLTGEFNEFGISGSLEATILDNMAQFTGNMINLFPFCGVRRGGPKPADCLGP